MFRMISFAWLAFSSATFCDDLCRQNLMRLRHEPLIDSNLAVDLDQASERFHASAAKGDPIKARALLRIVDQIDSIVADLETPRLYAYASALASQILRVIRLQAWAQNKKLRFEGQWLAADLPYLFLEEHQDRRRTQVTHGLKFFNPNEPHIRMMGAVTPEDESSSIIHFRPLDRHHSYRQNQSRFLGGRHVHSLR